CRQRRHRGWPDHRRPGAARTAAAACDSHRVRRPPGQGAEPGSEPVAECVAVAVIDLDPATPPEREVSEVTRRRPVTRLLAADAGARGAYAALTRAQPGGERILTTAHQPCEALSLL